jgi:hypothetical protein
VHGPKPILESNPSSKGIGDAGAGSVMDQELVLDAMEEASGFSSNISIQAQGGMQSPTINVRFCSCWTVATRWQLWSSYAMGR